MVKRKRISPASAGQETNSDDFASGRQRQSSEVLEEQLTYWEDRLGGLPPALALPADHPRPAVNTGVQASRSARLPEELSEALKDLAHQENCTMFMVLLAALQVLLYRYSGQEDITVGSPITVRNRPKSGALIGSFDHVLALRTDLSGEPTFGELLGRVREVTLDAYAHRDLPYEMLVERLRPDFGSRFGALFQVLFILENPGSPEAGISPGIEMRQLEVDTGAVSCHLILYVTEDAEGLETALKYNSDLFDSATIDRMLAHMRVLLEGAATAPDTSIARLPLLPPAERHQVLFEWNNTAAPYPQGRVTHQLIEAQAAQTPDSVAVSDGEEYLTYAGLNQKANQLARYLRKLGVGPESLVGVCIGRSLELAVALLGVWKAGGACVPIDPADPVERIAFILADLGAYRGESQLNANGKPVPGTVGPVLLTQARLLAKLLTEVRGTQEALGSVRPAGGGAETAQRTQPRPLRLTDHTSRIVCLDTDWERIGREPTEALASSVEPGKQVGPEHLACVIYNLGLSYQPEGVMVLHRGLVNYLTWCSAAYPLDLGLGTPIYTSISSDLTITSLLMPLISGGRVTMLPDEQALEVLGKAAGQDQDFTLIKITPDNLKTFGDQISPESAASRTHAFILSGEQPAAEQIAFWQQHAPKTVLVNEYGAAETAAGCCVYRIPPGTSETGVIPIGRPIINTQLYILDEYLQPVPIGVPGELFIGGAGLARGYLNRADLTEERFIPNPYPLEEQGIAASPLLYRTGDLCRYLPDGNIEWLGRIDDPVKGRGFRFEPGLKTRVAAPAQRAGLSRLPFQRFGVPARIGQASTQSNPQRFETVPAEQGLITGPVPLSAIQRWFFEVENSPNPFNTSRLFELEQPADTTYLAKTVQSLLAHHDALRMRFRRVGHGWEQHNPEPNGKIPLTTYDLAEVPSEHQDQIVEVITADLQRVFDLSSGPLLHVAYFDLGRSQRPRLLIKLHRLVADSIAWQVFLEDFASAYLQLSTGQAVNLPAKTVSFKTWAEWINEYAQQPELLAGLDDWMSFAAQELPCLPVDFPAGANLYGSAGIVSAGLTTEETRRLLQEAPVAAGVQVSDLLHTALARAVALWSGESRLLVDLEGNGRVETPEGMDLSRTMGWFSSKFPALLDLEGFLEPGQALRRVRDQLRQLPHRGFDYGLLRYLHRDPEVRRCLSTIPPAELSFTYSGELGEIARPNWFQSQPGQESIFQERDPAARRSALLYSQAQISGDILQVQWSFSKNVHRPETIQRLADVYIEELRFLMEYCLAHPGLI